MLPKERWIQMVILAVASLAFMSSTARAQGLTFNAAAETGGDNLHVLFSEIGMAHSGLGFRPVASLGGHVSFQRDLEDGWGITPAAGLRYTADQGFTQVKVGWAFRNEEATPFFGGADSGLYTELRSEYWGTGTWWGSGLANYNWGGNYLWSRGQLGRNVVELANGGSIGIGAEAAYQLEAEDRTPGVQGLRVTQIGPVLRWNMGGREGRTLNLSGGWRESQFNRDVDNTWYLRAELKLP